MRMRFSHPIEQEPVDCPSRLDGHSTVHFASSGLEFYSVDINKQAIALAREYTKGYKNTKIIENDGIEFLKRFNKKIDLLFLDAWDVDLPDCAAKHLEAYNTAKTKINLTTGLLMIDDCDVDFVDKRLQKSLQNYGGKGEKVIPVALNEGWKVLSLGRCVILTK